MRYAVEQVRAELEVMDPADLLRVAVAVEAGFVVLATEDRLRLRRRLERQRLEVTWVAE